MTVQKVGWRIIQKIFRVFYPSGPWWHEPELLLGENALSKLPDLIKSKSINNVLVVTDKQISQLGLMDPMLKRMDEIGVKYIVFDEVVPNPTIDNVEAALQLYQSNHCQGLVGFGGGSSMDCAKGIGARVANPNKQIPQMRGVLKVRKRIPTLFAVPTTAGTGSETTVAAVITNSKTHEKYALNDFQLIPRYAVLDPMLTIGLPPHITSTTGMDALTHAVEAYIGNSNTRYTKKMAIDAAKLIFKNISKVYHDGKDIEARQNMLTASYYAGIAFTRAYVGYVHAVAHTLGGFYGVPHGLANAVILPIILEQYGESAWKPLAELADAVDITRPSDTEEQKAKKFIEAIKTFNKDMNIPTKIDGILDKDIPIMAARASQEANPLYPCPMLYTKNEIQHFYKLIQA